jgi:hypothetical protein
MDLRRPLSLEELLVCILYSVLVTTMDGLVRQELAKQDLYRARFVRPVCCRGSASAFGFAGVEE